MNTTFSSPRTAGSLLTTRATSLIELDDQLGVPVARRRLAGEDLDPRHPVPLRMRADRVIERDRLEDVEELALVFVDALDLDVEQRVGSTRDAQPVA